MSSRDYRVERSSRPAAREPYDDYDPVSRQRSRRDYEYDDPYPYPRGSRDALSRMTTRSERGSALPGSEVSAATKTTYKVAREGASERYVKKGNVIVLDSRLDRDRDLSDWEVIRPERSESGAYVIETSSTSDYASPPGRRRDSFYDEARRPNIGRDNQILSAPRSRRERSMSRGTLEAIQQVRVTEDNSSDEERQNSRPRRTPRPHTKAEIDAAVGSQSTVSRLKSIIRHEHSPESVTRRRSRSIGFIKQQLSHHDATESKHERPGAEANVAGRYLIDHRGERIRRKDDSDDDDASRGGYQVRRSKTDVIDTYGAEVERRRRDGRTTERYEEDEYDRRGGEPYPPQRHRGRYRGDDDDDDKYSEYHDKRSAKKYY